MKASAKFKSRKKVTYITLNTVSATDLFYKLSAWIFSAIFLTNQCDNQIRAQCLGQ